ncbi:tetratricopeptide repeat protein [Flavobacterium praedii]|uniref:tetratricopeptide repeat protein n=1 Tax=Flavobacterium praedii TaxID=3002900 RepID=UPI002481FB2D|nr:hypothetical protein [Flavobacterium praedii]
MKNIEILCFLLTSIFSSNSWGQNTAIDINNKKVSTTQSNILIMKDKTYTPNKRIKYYHVEEITMMKFGGYKTVYDVSNPKLIRTYDLGTNNKRIVTPIFVDGDQLEKSILNSDTLLRSSIPSKILFSDTPKKADSYASIDIIKTYERVAEKGFESLDMMKKLANSYFFNDEFDKAEKYYTKIFAKTTDIEPEYYYRYSITLKAVGKIEKSNEYLKKFNQLSSNSTR